MYSLPASTAAVSGETISSTKWNSLTQDLEADMNVDRPIVAGGTGASTALAALTNLFSGASPGGADKIGFWDQSAASFAFLSLGTGLSFNGTSLDLDADLSTLAGLTVAADNFIAGNSGGTAWEVKTPAQARTSLGLVIGTNVQAWDADLDTYAANPLTAAELGELQNIGTTTISATQWGYLGATGGTIWTTANDGAGSGLDADTIDGVQESALAKLSGGTFTGAITISTASPFFATVDSDNSSTCRFNGSSSSASGSLRLEADVDNILSGSSILFFVDGTQKADIDENGEFSSTTIVARVAASSTTTGTLTSASANKTIQATGDITINNSVFSAGDIILIYAGASARTITQGSGVTMRLGGTATTGSRTLAARGVAMLFFVSASEVVVSGSAVT